LQERQQEDKILDDKLKRREEELLSLEQQETCIQEVISSMTEELDDMSNHFMYKKYAFLTMDDI